MLVSLHFSEPEDSYSLHKSQILILSLHQLNPEMLSHSVSIKSTFNRPYLSILTFSGAMDPFGTTVEIYFFSQFEKHLVLNGFIQCCDLVSPSITKISFPYLYLYDLILPMVTNGTT
jgi:hypothetical protein